MAAAAAAAAAADRRTPDNWESNSAIGSASLETAEGDNVDIDGGWALGLCTLADLLALEVPLPPPRVGCGTLLTPRGLEKDPAPRPPLLKLPPPPSPLLGESRNDMRSLGPDRCSRVKWAEKSSVT